MPSADFIGLITFSRSGVLTYFLNGCASSLLSMPGGGLYSPLSRCSLMVCRISAGERRMLLSVSMSASDGGMNCAFS
ncbi:hypothetical protein D3C86_675560 [compost metagenome]